MTHNEWLFLAHILGLQIALIFAMRLGKTGLITFLSLAAVLANLFVIKQIDLFGLHVTGSDAFIISSVLALNLLQEKEGKQSAQKATWISFGSTLFFAGASQIHLAYKPNLFDATQSAFSTILSPTPRIIFASLATFFLVQRLEVLLFAKIREKWRFMPFTFRSALSMTLSQAIDTVLFSFLGLYGQVGSIIHIIFVSFILKIGIIACSSSLISLLKPLMEREPPSFLRFLKNRKNPKRALEESTHPTA